MLKYSHPTLAWILDYWPITVFMPTVLLLGNESDGLAREWVEMSDERVTIPMAVADSLNVVVAAGIFLHWLRFGGSQKRSTEVVMKGFRPDG